MTSIDRQSGGAAPIMLSSDALDPRDRFDAWREELMLRVMRVDVSVPDKTSFHTRLRVLALPNISIIERRSTPSVVGRTAELVRDGDDSLIFSLPWRKSIEARGPAVEARVGPGEAIIHSLSEITRSRSPEGFRGVSLRIARQAARNVAPYAERRLNRAIAVDRTASLILQSYLVSLVSNAGGLSPSVATLADRHLSELMANIFDPEGDLGSTSLFGGGAAFAHLYKNSVPQGDACSSSVVGNCGAVGNSFAFNQELSAPANTLQTVEIQLSGSTQGFGGGPYTATIDPLITIAPSSAAEGYTLVLSPNVTQESVAPSVPEPSTWAMLLTGFATLGFAYRVRRRGSLAAPSAAV